MTVPKHTWRFVFAAAVTGVLLWLVLATMARLPWQLDVLIAALVALAFAFYFERDPSPGVTAHGALTKATKNHDDHKAM
jgi:hypothetical protein